MTTDSNNDQAQEDKSKIAKIRYKTNVVRLFIEIAILIGICVSIYFSYENKKDTALIQDDTVSILNLINNPLQGIWSFRSQYEKYYDEDEPEDLGGTGKALIIWNPEYKKYEILIGYKIVRNGVEDSNLETLTALTLAGDFVAKKDGTPDDGFTVKLDLIARHSRIKGQTTHDYYYKNCKYEVSPEKGNTISCDFVTTKSRSKVILRHERSIKSKLKSTSR